MRKHAPVWIAMPASVALIELQHWCGLQSIFGLKAAPVLEFVPASEYTPMRRAHRGDSRNHPV
jgi:hypothetical protein